MNEMSRKPAHTVTELASARQHQEHEIPADHHGARGDSSGGGVHPVYNAALLRAFLVTRRAEVACRLTGPVIKTPPQGRSKPETVVAVRTQFG